MSTATEWPAGPAVASASPLGRPVAAAIAVYGAAALHRPGLLPRRALAVGAIGAIIAVGAGPAAYAVATSGRALSGNNVTAGPATALSFGGPGGGMGDDQGTTSPSGSAAPIIIATGKPVVTMGGFNGGEPAPTVRQLAAMVRHGELRYALLGGGAFRGGGGGSAQSAIEQWVKAQGKAVTVAGSTGGSLYRVSA